MVETVTRERVSIESGLLPIEARVVQQSSAAGRNAPERAAGERWYRSPVLWLGIALLAATVAGCIFTIALALRFADTPLPIDEERVFRMPAAHAPPSGTTVPQPRE